MAASSVPFYRKPSPRTSPIISPRYSLDRPDLIPRDLTPPPLQPSIVADSQTLNPSSPRNEGAPLTTPTSGNPTSSYISARLPSSSFWADLRQGISTNNDIKEEVDALVRKCSEELEEKLCRKDDEVPSTKFAKMDSTRDFFDRRKLEELLLPKQARKQTADHKSDNQANQEFDRLVDAIRGKKRSYESLHRILATLVHRLSGRRAVTLFIDAINRPDFITDADLPLSKDRCKELFGQDGHHFYENQFVFKPTTFREGVHNIWKAEEHPPLLSEIELDSGGSGDVYLVTLATGGFQYKNGSRNWGRKVLVKKVLKREGEYKHESMVNRQLLENSTTHRNILQFFGSAEWGKELSLWFEPAEATFATLLKENRWKSEMPVPLLLCAFADLCEALDHIHHGVKNKAKVSLQGMHGDISGANIMFTYKDKELMLKLIDFGLTRLKKPWEKDWTRQSLHGSCPAPELIFQNRMYSASDIWAIGCLLVEYLSYIIGGSELVEEFRSTIMILDSAGYTHAWFFDVGTRTVKGKVVDWMKELPSRASDSLGRAVAHVLSFLQRDVFIINPEKRCTAARICGVLCEAIGMLEGQISSNDGPARDSARPQTHVSQAGPQDTSPPHENQRTEAHVEPVGSQENSQNQRNISPTEHKESNALDSGTADQGQTRRGKSRRQSWLARLRPAWKKVCHLFGRCFHPAATDIYLHHSPEADERSASLDSLQKRRSSA